MKSRIVFALDENIETERQLQADLGQVREYLRGAFQALRIDQREHAALMGVAHDWFSVDTLSLAINALSKGCDHFKRLASDAKGDPILEPLIPDYQRQADLCFSLLARLNLYGTQILGFTEIAARVRILG